jgi:hypothetical protein
VRPSQRSALTSSRLESGDDRQRYHMHRRVALGQALRGSRVWMTLRRDGYCGAAGAIAGLSALGVTDRMKPTILQRSRVGRLSS